MEGRAEGLAEGKNLANIATARKLQSLGVPLEVIQSATGLSREDIDRLHENGG